MSTRAGRLERLRIAVETAAIEKDDQARAVAWKAADWVLNPSDQGLAQLVAEAHAFIAREGDHQRARRAFYEAQEAQR